MRGVGGCGVKVVVRRHGLDLLLDVPAVALHAGVLPNVKCRHPHTLLLTTVPSRVSRMVEEGAGAVRPEEVAGITHVLQHLHDTPCLNLQLSLDDPEHTPAGTAPAALSLEVRAVRVCVDVVNNIII
jgi:hypothetical protein